jgi:hypothetical protein
MTLPDKRITPYREDIAADFLEGQVPSERFVKGEQFAVLNAVTSLYPKPSRMAVIDSQALMGDCFTVYEQKDGWAWGQLASDGYVGYLPLDAIGPWKGDPTHRVNVPRTFIYPGANIKLPVLGYVTLNAGVRVLGFDGDFARTSIGHFIFKEHLSPWNTPLTYDYVEIAERFISTPYLWGGKSSIGIDCSGLVQMALHAVRKPAPRDTDMQEAALGFAVPVERELANLKRGDLVFWKGHVAIMTSQLTIVHATAHHMMTFVEPLAKAERRIREKTGNGISSIRRMQVAM